MIRPLYVVKLQHDKSGGGHIHISSDIIIALDLKKGDQAYLKKTDEDHEFNLEFVK